MTLIDAITLFNQHQRPIRRAVVAGQAAETVETTLARVEIANRLAHEVLGRSLDELPPQTRRMLAVIFLHVQETAKAKAIRPGDVRFSRADIRRRAGLADTQCRLHLDRLAALEFLLTHRGRRGQSFEYELLFDGDIAAGTPHLPGLIEAGALDSLCSTPTTSASRGETPQNAGSARGHGGANAAPARTIKTPAKPGAERGFEESAEPEPESHPLRVNGHAGSYPQTVILPLAASA